MIKEIEKNNNSNLTNNLTINKIYRNEELVQIFQCSNMGGMRRSKKTNTLVLTAMHNKPLYEDTWERDNIFNYTGMGTIGDQDIKFSQNAVLATSNETKIELHLFESYKTNEYYYRGIVFLTGPPFIRKEPDNNGKIRNALKFPLKRVDDKNQIYIRESDVKFIENEKNKAIKKLDSIIVKERAKSAKSNNEIRKVITTLRDRNHYVAEYTKNRAEGICDLCQKYAPFNDKNGSPFLEEHHVVTLSQGGPDEIHNTVALCPNCHKKIHILNEKSDQIKLEQMLLKYLISDNDEEGIKKYRDTFKK